MNLLTQVANGDEQTYFGLSIMRFGFKISRNLVPHYHER